MAEGTKENLFTVTLADGKQISGLTVSGNTFLGASTLSAKDFAGKLQKIEITCSEPESYRDQFNLLGVHEAVSFVDKGICEDNEFNRECYKDAIGKYQFSFIMPSADELREMQMNARLAYLEMLEGVDDE